MQREGGFMKKWICLFSAGLLLFLCACGKTAYSFPETIEQLRVKRGTMANAFTEKEKESIRLFTEWFDTLELEKCKQPEQIDENDCYSFEINGEDAFVYVHRSEEIAYVIIDGAYYQVKNPSLPPMEESGGEKQPVDSVTIVRTASPPVCKTTSDPETVREVQERINGLEKETVAEVAAGGWLLKMDFSEGSWYTLSGDTLCSDKANYRIDRESANALYTDLLAIYAAMGEKETVYP